MYVREITEITVKVVRGAKLDLRWPEMLKGVDYCKRHPRYRNESHGIGAQFC